jgi:hypothetical protein
MNRNFCKGSVGTTDEFMHSGKFKRQWQPLFRATYSFGNIIIDIIFAISGSILRIENVLFVGFGILIEKF